MGSFISSCSDCCCRVIVKLYTSAERRKLARRNRRPISNRPKFLRIRRKKRAIICKCRICSCYFNQIKPMLAKQPLSCWSIVKDSEYSFKNSKKTKMVSSQPTPSPRDDFEIKKDTVVKFYSTPKISIHEEPCIKRKIVRPKPLSFSNPYRSEPKRDESTQANPKLDESTQANSQLDESTQANPQQSSKNIETDKANFNKQNFKLDNRDIATSPLQRSQEKILTTEKAYQSKPVNTKEFGFGQHSYIDKNKSGYTSNVSSRSSSPSKIISNRNPIQNQSYGGHSKNTRANTIKNHSRNSSSGRLNVEFESNFSSRSNTPSRSLRRNRKKNRGQSNACSRNSSPVSGKSNQKYDGIKIIKGHDNTPNIPKGYNLFCDCTKQSKGSQCGNSFCQMYCNKKLNDTHLVTKKPNEVNLTRCNKPKPIKREMPQDNRPKDIKGLDLAATINEAIIRNRLESPRPLRKDPYCTKPTCCSTGPSSPNCKRRTQLCYNALHQPKVICGIKIFNSRKANSFLKKQNKNPIIRSPGCMTAEQFPCKRVACRDINIQTCSPHQSSVAIGTETDYQICRALNMYTRGDNENIGSFSIDAYYTR